MAAYQIKTLQTDFKKEWNEFVKQHLFGNPLQLWEWGEVKRSNVWCPIRLGIFQKNKLLGTAQILRRFLPSGFSLLYCPRGPTLDWNSPNPIEPLNSLLNYIKNKYSSIQTFFLRLEPPITKSNKLSSIKTLRPYFKSIQPSHTSTIDLTQSLETIMYKMDKDTRYSIRRAAREGVRVVKDQGENITLWETFYEMYQKTAFKRFPPRAWRQFEKIFQLMAPPNQAQLYLSYLPAKPEKLDQDLPTALIKILPSGSRIIAGAVILKTQQLGCYLWGTSAITKRTKNLYAPYILQWQIIQSLKKEGIKEYDLWGIAPTDNPKHAWSGHTLFKKGFGGDRVDYSNSLDLPLSPLYWIYRRLDYTRQRILQPDLIEKPTP